jgi:hypothetical protein
MREARPGERPEVRERCVAESRAIEVQRHEAPETRQCSEGFASDVKPRTIQLCELCEAPDVTEASITYLTVRDI